MDRDANPDYEHTLTIVLRALLGALREQGEAVAVGQRAADQWQRRAVLGTATVANELGLRIREAEARERQLRRRLAELASDKSEHPEELRTRLARILGAGAAD